MHAVAVVTSNDSVVVDAGGRQAGGRDWVVVDLDDFVTEAQIQNGNLRVVDKPDDTTGMNPAAQAAFAELDALEPGTTVNASATDDQLAAMTAEELIDYVTTKRPSEKPRVYELEVARSHPRKTVLAATEPDGQQEAS